MCVGQITTNQSAYLDAGIADNELAIGLAVLLQIAVVLLQANRASLLDTRIAGSRIARPTLAGFGRAVSTGARRVAVDPSFRRFHQLERVNRAVHVVDVPQQLVVLLSSRRHIDFSLFRPNPNGSTCCYLKVYGLYVGM